MPSRKHHATSHRPFRPTVCYPLRSGQARPASVRRTRGKPRQSGPHAADDLRGLRQARSRRRDLLQLWRTRPAEPPVREAHRPAELDRHGRRHGGPPLACRELRSLGAGRPAIEGGERLPSSLPSARHTPMDVQAFSSANRVPTCCKCRSMFPVSGSSACTRAIDATTGVALPTRSILDRRIVAMQSVEATARRSEAFK